MPIPGIASRPKPALWLVLALLYATRLSAQTNQTIYTDSLQNGWSSESWATVNFSNTSPVHSGSDSISVNSTYYEALYLHHNPMDSSIFTNLVFWINGGSSADPNIIVQATRNGNAQPAVSLAALPINSWRQITLSLPSLGIVGATDFDGFWIQVQNSGTAPTFYVDDITLIGGTNPAPPLVITTNNASITVNAALNRHPISPLIYGVAFGATNDLLALNTPLNRYGGNTTSRYNWQLNADNHAADYFYASLAEDSSTPGALVDTFVTNSRIGGAQPTITIPMIDWIAKLAAQRARTWSYSIAKYGPQQENDSVDGWPDMGNGVRPNGSLITTNDPNDANVPNSVALEQGWLSHLTNTWGPATNGGVQYYHLDNEPGIWDSTHQDVHPNGVTMDELVNKMTNYAAMIKAVDPGALIMGPDDWSIDAAIFSATDNLYEAANGYPGTYPDRTAHGGLDVYPYVLRQMAIASTNAGHRLLDVCTLHAYPQGDEFSDAIDLSTVLLRNRSTRQFWDTNYVNESWLADNPLTATVAQIPVLHQWVATNFPGTLIGITEYNWGAESNISGATAQADILGIFGREGLDVGERWTVPAENYHVYRAMQMYRNYDGKDSTFGDTSIYAGGPNPDLISVFAATRSTDGALTIMAINKQPGTNTTVSINITNFSPTAAAQVWQLTSSNIIAQLTNVTLTNSAITTMLPAQSITLFVVPANLSPILTNAVIKSGQFSFYLAGQTNQSYAILASSNLHSWASLQTDTLSGGSLKISFPMTNTVQFYRAQSVP